MEAVRRVHRDEATWRGIIARQAASGLGVSQFCLQEQLHATVFRRWRARLQGAMPVARAAAEAKKPAFVDLGDLQGRQSACEIRLELGSGVTLTLVRR